MWQSREETNFTYDIRGQIVNATGEPQTDTFTINESNRGKIKEPEVAALPAGGFAVTWTEGVGPYDQSGFTRILSRRFNETGEASGEPIVMQEDSPRTESGDPDIAPLANNGFAVTWRQQTSSSASANDEEFDIKAQRIGAPVTEVRHFNYDNAQYQVVSAPEGIAWQDAKTYAVQQGGHLVTLDSPEENDVIRAQIADLASAWNDAESGTEIGPWIGAKETAEGELRWITGEAFDFTNWAANEPDGPDTESGRVHLISDTESGQRAVKWNLKAGNSSFGDSGTNDVSSLIVERPFQIGSSEGETLTGDEYQDRIEGRGGADTLKGLGGDDYLDGEDGNDTVLGGNGRDRLIGRSGDDTIIGGESEEDRRDAIFGGDGGDTLNGNHGNDRVNGGAGPDELSGGFGVDRIIGGEGDDVETGGAYSDIMFGGPGFDFINGGFGHDRLNGGEGGDRFFHTGNQGHASDWVQDYSASDGDSLTYGGDTDQEYFQVNTADSGSGDPDVDEAFVIYRPTQQILWALVDGADKEEINLSINGQTEDLIA